MDLNKAKEIVQRLADGIDPITGEVYPPESLYNNPDVIRALMTVLNAVNMPTKAAKKTIEERQQDNLDNGRPKNAGLPWSDQQKKEVGHLFNQGKTVKELSLLFERTTGAIKSELTRQGLIE